MNWQETYRDKLISFDDAAKIIESGDRIWMAAGNSAPADLMSAINRRYLELENVTVSSGLAMYPFEHFKPEYKGHIHHHTIIVGPVERKFMPFGNIDVTSFQFSHDLWFTPKSINPSVVIAEVSEPDERGYMCLSLLAGMNCENALSTADRVIVQVNKKTPYIYGMDNLIHVSQCTAICEKDHVVPELPNIPITDLEKQIAAYIVDRVPDGATIQLGFGGIANAVGFFLENKKDLGIHTECIVDSIVQLAKKGVVNGSKKNFHKGKIVTGFVIGTKETYDFVHKNQMIFAAPTKYVTDVQNIAKNDNMISINGALCVDLTGQVGAESLGFDMFSGTGGQVDFVCGSQRSKGGASYIAFKSFAKLKDGTRVSTISAGLPLGTAVTTLRTDVQNIVTEYGVAEIGERPFSERAKKLIAIAHPDFREKLTFDAKKVGIIY